MQGGQKSIDGQGDRGVGEVDEPHNHKYGWVAKALNFDHVIERHCNGMALGMDCKSIFSAPSLFQMVTA